VPARALKTIADYTGIAFANASLYEQALHLGNTDPLTGVNNRARLNEIIAESEKADDMHRRRFDRESYLVAVMVDIDNFKDINDTHSHREGDRVLKKTAFLLRSCVRGDDTIFRIGGDEFLVLLNEAVKDNLDRIVARVKEDMEKISRFTVEKDIKVGFSYGVATGPLHKISEIIHQADMAMYTNKRGE